MKLKSVLSLLLCFLLCFSPAFAQSESESMQTALEYAKTILNVPEEYTEFTYRAQTAPDGEVSWIFIWSGENKGDMQVYLSEDGFVSAYYSWIYADSYDETLANYTHEEAREIAKEFIQRVNPELYPYLREVTPDGENRDSRTAYFTFQEFCGEIPVFANTVSVTVDKYHGNVKSYHGTRKAEGLPETTALLKEEEAKEAYLRDIGVQMEYRMYYNSKDKAFTVFPVYSLKDTTGKAIDAVTGGVVEPYFSEESPMYGSTNGAMDNSTSKEESVEVGFSPAELEALSNVGEVYSKEEALTIATKKIPALEEYTLQTASLHQNYRDETKLYWYFDLKKEDNSYADVQLDAKTGQLISFSMPEEPSENKSFSREDAKTVAEAFFKTEASDVFAQTAYMEEGHYGISPGKEEQFPSSYYITYQRMENGIPVNGNYLNVRVDSATKQVGSFNRSFTDNLDFPDVSSAMSEKEILEVMDQKMDFAQTYIPVKDRYVLAYTFQNASSTLFDVYSGNRLNYRGTSIQETVVPQYTDIAGHWAEEMILALLDNGYYISENEFRPDEVITKKEFLQLFLRYSSDLDDDIKQMIAEVEGIPVEQVNVDAVMTKEELSCYFVYQLGYQKIAKKDEIFRYPFPDEADASDSLKGDITILAGLGVFKGSNDGNFYPKKQLTRAEAVSAIYHYFVNAQ